MDKFLVLDSAFNGNIEEYIKHRETKLKKYEIDCIINGIYMNYNFAKWAKDNIDLNDRLNRAISASFIMNNDLSFIKEDIYCIWYPKQAKEETYRKLYRLFPKMKYIIARACVISGYNKLYKELEVQPEVNIMMEAYFANNLEVYNLTMESEIKYYVMDDYTLKCYNPIEVNYNYNDTCITSKIKEYPSICYKGESHQLKEHVYFDLLENNNISDVKLDNERGKLYSKDSIDRYYLIKSHFVPNYIYVNKDLLILYSAYTGDIKKYKLLRRPSLISKELHCIIRGIYYNYEFAKWVKDNINLTDRFSKAINASFLMNNNICDFDNINIPYLIWYPKIADETTYKHYYMKYPKMKYNIARACTIAGYNELYKYIDPLPEINILSEAKDCNNLFVINEIMSKIKEHGKIWKKMNEGYEVYLTDECEEYFEGMGSGTLDYSRLKSQQIKDLTDEQYKRDKQHMPDGPLSADDIYSNYWVYDLLQNDEITDSLLQLKLRCIEDYLEVNQNTRTAIFNRSIENKKEEYKNNQSDESDEDPYLNYLFL